jgi:hypothetical protein
MSVDRSIINVPRTAAPTRVPIVPRVELPDVPTEVREQLDAFRATAAAEKTARAVRRRRALESLIATGKHIYTGTVPAHVIARRRKAGKAARIARRAARA